MSGVYNRSFDSDSPAAETEILGGSTQTKIGNVDDRLKVDIGGATITAEAQGRLRTTETTALFEAYFSETDKNGVLHHKETTGGTVTRDTSTNSMVLATTTSSGSRAVLQTHYFHYIAGQTITVGITAIFGTTDTNCRKRMGYFDDDNGIYLEYDGTNLSFNIRTNGGGASNQTVNRSSFNTNTLDGFDPTKYYLFELTFLWQGAGPVSLYAYISGERTLLHMFECGSTLSHPFMKVPNLPIRAEIINAGITGSVQSFSTFCWQLSAEGNRNVFTQERAAVSTGVSVATSAYKPLISIRLKSTNARAQFQLRSAKIHATSNDDLVYRISKGVSLTGASFTSVDAASIMEYDISATSSTGGTAVNYGFIAKSGTVPGEAQAALETIQSDFDGVVDILTLEAKSITSTATVYGALVWVEIF